MRDSGITQERYRETKAMIDDIIVDGDYRRSDEPYYDPDVTMLEVLRVMFAYNMAKSSKKLRSREQLESFVDKEGIRTWLDWVHKTRNGGVDNGYGHLIESPESYRHSPGITRWVSFGMFMHNGQISGPGRTDLYYNRILKRFQEQRCRFDDDIVTSMTHDIERGVREGATPGLVIPDIKQIRENFQDLMKESYRNSMADVRIPFGARGATMSLQHDPFLFGYGDLVKQARIQTSESERFRMLSDTITDIVSTAKWPDDARYEVTFSVTGATCGEADDADATRRMVIQLRFRQLDHLLESRDIIHYLGGMDYSIDLTAGQLVEKFMSQKDRGTLLSDEIAKTAKREASKMARRKRKADRIGSGNIDVDHVAVHLLDLVKQYNPEAHEEITAGRRVSIGLPLDMLEGFIGGRSPKDNAKSRKKRKKENISFILHEGQMRSRFHINDDIYWDKGRMKVGRLPETAMAGLIGKPARAVVDHPIADLLGTVSKAYPARWGDSTWITFTPLIETTSVSST
ncbi:hypothetical protein [uncultured Salinicola sp.]|uniref:hypothetical protein n=1 Tax=uncultured Salinicola sp. TaxID=1193542 RepID=UPI002638F19D|nr:hypothetical protein [uncultured Salinicola sp.]|tara:strand:+ start:3602 stop:5146 length:1545 start_codon:yes stop_codon:yes gene_type:complete